PTRRPSDLLGTRCRPTPRTVARVQRRGEHWQEPARRRREVQSRHAHAWRSTAPESSPLLAHSYVGDGAVADAAAPSLWATGAVGWSQESETDEACRSHPRGFQASTRAVPHHQSRTARLSASQTPTT